MDHGEEYIRVKKDEYERLKVDVELLDDNRKYLNNKLKELEAFIKSRIQIIKEQPSKDLEVDEYFIDNLNSCLKIIERLG